ncbi:hypothetical protein ACH47X_15940 [Promicromonospora kroppenstedtii]|uniref:Uncharacterized protein n=1 Tax=Promicromonospora kroppenstedtii TaxID=440482 RepID=A0ABW7XMC2_9MICO
MRHPAGRTSLSDSGAAAAHLHTPPTTAAATGEARDSPSVDQPSGETP